MKNLSTKIFSIAVLFFMTVSLTACKKIPSGPVAGGTSDTHRASTESISSVSENGIGGSDSPNPADTDAESDATSSKKKLPDTGSSDLWTEPADLSEAPTYNTDITPIAPDEYYGRTWLLEQPNKEKLIRVYDNLIIGTEAMVEGIPIPVNLTYDELVTVWECYRADYPQHFWVGGGFQYYRTGSRITSIAPNYKMTLAEKEEAQPRFHAAVREILSQIDSTMSPYEIEKTLHDRLILGCTYRERTNAHNAYGALVDGVAVCEGIARAFQYLCLSAGIQTLYVEGTSGQPTEEWTGHAWNVVFLEGEPYHVDVTWDNRNEPTEDRIHYAWFNVTTQQIREDHKIKQSGYAIPECVATDANYFVENDLILPTLTVEDILSLSQKQNDGYVFRAYVTGEENVSAWVKENARTIAQNYGLNGYSYTLHTAGKEVILLMTNYKG